MTSSLELNYTSLAEEMSERARLVEVLTFASEKLGCIYYTVHLVNGKYWLYLGPQDPGALVLFSNSRWIKVSKCTRSEDVILHLDYCHDFLRD